MSELYRHQHVPPRLTDIYATYSTPLYYVTICTHHRQAILATPAIHNAFREAGCTAGQHGAAIGRYVIMPDHIHLFVRIGHSAKLSTTITCLKRNISKQIHSSSPNIKVWQSGFFDRLIRNNESYTDKWTYVYLNPVRAELTLTPEEWKFQGELNIIDRA